MLGDLRLLVRGLLRSPAYTVIAAGTLGLAIGLNTVIFSLVSLFLFERFPMVKPERIAFIRARNVQQDLDYLGIPAADFLEYQRETTVFEHLAGTDRMVSHVLELESGPQRVRGYGVSWSLLTIWRLEPALGRDFLPEDDRPGAPPVAILGHGFWQRQFGGDPDIVGSQLRLDGRETTVIGIMNPAVALGFYSGIEVWTPLRLDPQTASRTWGRILPEGRLRDGRTLAAAREEIGRIAEDIQRRYPASHAGLEVRVLSWNDTLSTPQSTLMMLFLLLTVSLVMLVACSNVATLMLARASVRAREHALKVALGAGRRRVAYHLVIEGALLAVLALGVGLLMTSWLHGLLLWFSGEDGAFTILLKEMQIDWRVLLFAGAIGLLAPLLIACLPVAYTMRLELTQALNAGGRSAVQGGGLRMRRAMVVVQVALALALTTSAGVLIRSMVDLQTQELGFAADDVLAFSIQLPADKYPDDARRDAFYDAGGARIRGLPGVAGAVWSNSRPLSPAGARRNLTIRGRDHPPEQLPWAAVQFVDPGYHEVLEIPLLEGRRLRESDGTDGPRVGLISRRLVEQHWPDGSPIGAIVEVDGGEGEQPPIEIVGVVADVYSGITTQPITPVLYLPREQHPQAAMYLIVRSRLPDPTALAPELRRQIWAVDPALPVERLMTVREFQGILLSGFSLIGVLLAVFAGLALLMAAAGIYGVTAFSVAQRSREIGLRMALGAVASDLRRVVVGQVLRLTLIGLVLGLGGAAALNRVLASALSETRPGDPLTFAAAAVVLLTVALLAAYRPVRAATRVDPIKALRAE